MEAARGFRLGLRLKTDGINFLTQTGVDTHYFFRDRTASTGEWRQQHISNARINTPSRSSNASVFFAWGSRIFSTEAWMRSSAPYAEGRVAAI
jgi:hypothetical protein